MRNITIEKIKQNSRNKNTYILHLTTTTKDKLTITVHESTLIEQGIIQGQVLPESLLEEILHHEKVKTAFQIATRFLAYRMRSIHEVEQHLKKNDHDEVTINITLSKLREMSYLDDDEFSKSFILEASQVGKKGPFLIEYELKKHHISPTIYNKYLDLYTRDAQFQNANFIGSNFLKKQHTSRKDAEQKVINTLIRKGYTIDIATSVCDRLLKDYLNPYEEWDLLCSVGTALHTKYRHRVNKDYYRLMKTSLHRKGYPMELIDCFLKKGRQAIENGEIDPPLLFLD